MKTNEELEDMLKVSFFDAYHNKLPAWITDYLHFHFYMDKQNRRLKLKVYLNEKLELKEGEYWEDTSGSLTRVSINPQTGEKEIIMLYEYNEHIIFRGWLDKSLVSQVEEVHDITQLKEDDYVLVDSI